ncbi:MAG: hypothetical protein HY343_00685 [Lentisphaerae bacterium]|nr:hypothetical protein [Lentisphaerota bacterium]
MKMRAGGCLWAVMGMAFVVAMGPSAHARRPEWTKAADLQAGTGAKDVAYSGTISAVKIKCVEGSVSINTIVVRQGGDKTAVPVTAQLRAGDEREIAMTNAVQATGLRISDDGNGKYEVYVKTAGESGAKKESGGDWKTVGEFQAGGNAKEATFAGTASTCRIKCVEGTVSINTIVVRQGGDKTAVPVTAKLNAGEEREVALGQALSVTGFRISDDGRGRYQLSVK